MPRVSRIEYPGAIYYLTNRNDARTPIFRDRDDYLSFLFTLGKTCTQADWQVHGFVLDPERFRLIVETPGANLAAGMQRFLRAYTAHFNRRHGLTGELFVQRYKAKVVDGEGLGWLSSLCDYVHVHPAHAALLASEQPLRTYAWSSLPLYLQSPADRPDWFRVDRLFEQRRIDRDDAAGRAELERHLEQRRASRDKWSFRGIERGRCYGGYRFERESLRRHADHARGKGQGGVQPGPGEEKARHIVQEELGQLCWTAADLPRHRKSDPQKIRIAQRLRSETAMPLKWIARELHMGTPHYLALCLHHAKKKGKGQI